MKFNIRLFYLYLFSFVGLLVIVIGVVRLVDLGLKVYVFNNADVYTYVGPKPIAPDGIKYPTDEEMERSQNEETTRQRQRETAGSLSMIIVGLPLYIYHWRLIQKGNRKG